MKASLAAVVGLWLGLFCVLGASPDATAAGGDTGPGEAPDHRWVDLGGTASTSAQRSGREARVVVAESSATRLTVGMSISGMQLSTRELEDGRIYTAVSTSGSEAGVYHVGKPAVPVFGSWILIPNGTTVELEVDPGEPVVFDDILVAPVQPPHPDLEGQPRPVFDRSEAVYRTDAAVPGELAWLEPTKVMRGQELTILWLHPFQHNPVARTLTVYPDLTVTAHFAGEPRPIPARLRSESFERLMRHMAVNDEAVLAAEQAARAPESLALKAGHRTGALSGWNYIIITNNKFVQAAHDFAAWKKKCGFKTLVLATNAPALTIRALLEAIYEGWNLDVVPEYVLLLGDSEYVETNYEMWHPYNSSTKNSQGYVGSDLHYVAVEGNDLLADMHIGRIPVDTLVEATRITSRIKSYEENPPTHEPFYGNAAICAYFQESIPVDGKADRRFTQTSEDLAIFLSDAAHGIDLSVDRIYYTQPSVTPTHWYSGEHTALPAFGGGYAGDPNDAIPTYLERLTFAWDGDAADIKTAIESGRFLVTHRNHGDRQKWEHPEYTWLDIFQLLIPSGFSPVVWSVNCNTGWFDNETDFQCAPSVMALTDQTNSWDESFAESFLRYPIVGGPVGLVAATRVTESGFNDRFFWGLADAIWPTFIPTYGASSSIRAMGDVLDYAKLYMQTMFSSTTTCSYPGCFGWRDLHHEAHHWFGDPSMEIRLHKPAAVVAEYPSVWQWLGFPNTLVTQIDWDEGDRQGGPVVGATVTISRPDAPDDYWVATTDGSGQAVFDDLLTSLPGEYDVVATARDAIPFQGTFVSEAGSTGGILLDRELYSCSSVVQITLADADLAGGGTVVVPVTTTGDDTEDVTLSETGSSTGIFVGTVPTESGSGGTGDGTLQVGHGETITAAYFDADDGFGGSATVEDSALTDCVAPVFAGVTAARGGRAVSWCGGRRPPTITDPLPTTVYRDLARQGREAALIGNTMAREHPDWGCEIGQLCTYLVRAVDAVGNEDSNSVEVTLGTLLEGVNVGAGSVGWEYPLRTSFEDSRTQVIYLADEVGRPSRIYTLALEIDTEPGQNLTNWTIRMRHTALATYAEPSWESEEWVTTFQRDETLEGTGWHTFVLDIPFQLNGADHLMVDFSYDNDGGSSDGLVHATDTGESRSIYFQSNGSDGTPLDWEGTTPTPVPDTRIPNIRLGVILSPIFVDGFESGDTSAW